VGGAPDYVGPLCGWRAWFLVEREEGLLLRSVVYETLWRPRRALLAECLSTARGGVHPAPGESCRCGIYATCEPARAARFLDGYRQHAREERLAGPVLGRVFLWGEVVECEAGWRAGRAYPAHLYLLDGTAPLAAAERARALARYGVPVEPLEARSSDELLATRQCRLSGAATVAGTRSRLARSKKPEPCTSATRRPSRCVGNRHSRKEPP
jgi:hypothetical protein